MTALRKEEETILSPDFLEEIKRIREERGISIEEVAERTNIKTSYIKAIEDGDLTRLPGGIYNRAYIKSVSEFLGISMKPYERKVESDEMIKEKQVRIELGKPLNASMPSKLTIVACLFTIFVLYSVFYGPRVSKKEKVENAIENYQEQQTELAEQQMEKATPEQKEIIESELQAKISDTSALIKQIPQVSPIQKDTQKYVENELVITLLAVSDVKVQVKDYFGKILLDKQMAASEAIMLNGSEQYSLVTGDIKNLEVYLDGVQVRDISKIEKSGNAYIFKTEKLVDAAESQPFQKEAPKAAEPSLKEFTNSPGEIPNADTTQNNPQGTGR